MSIVYSVHAHYQAHNNVHNFSNKSQKEKLNSNYELLYSYTRTSVIIVLHDDVHDHP